MEAEVLKEQKRELVEALGVFIEHERLIAPLAARILAMLILNGDQGTTFEQLVVDLEASKSTISTHLSALEAQRRIEYFTKCGDRKRYYAMAPGYVSQKIETLLSQWNKEWVLQKKTLAYKEHYNKIYPDSPLTTVIHENALDFLSQSIRFLEQMALKYRPGNKK